MIIATLDLNSYSKQKLLVKLTASLVNVHRLQMVYVK